MWTKIGWQTWRGPAAVQSWQGTATTRYSQGTFTSLVSCKADADYKFFDSEERLLEDLKDGIMGWGSIFNEFV